MIHGKPASINRQFHSPDRQFPSPASRHLTRQHPDASPMAGPEIAGIALRLMLAPAQANAVPGMQMFSPARLARDVGADAAPTRISRPSPTAASHDDGAWRLWPIRYRWLVGDGLAVVFLGVSILGRFTSLFPIDIRAFAARQPWPAAHCSPDRDRFALLLWQ